MQQGSTKRKRAEAVVDDDDDAGEDLKPLFAAANGCHGADARTPSPAPAEVPPHHQYGYPGMHDGAGAAFQTAQQEYEAYRQQEVRPETCYTARFSVIILVDDNGLARPLHYCLGTLPQCTIKGAHTSTDLCSCL